MSIKTGFRDRGGGKASYSASGLMTRGLKEDVPMRLPPGRPGGEIGTWLRKLQPGRLDARDGAACFLDSRSIKKHLRDCGTWRFHNIRPYRPMSR